METEGEPREPRDLANDKIMFDRYYCINSIKPLKKKKPEEKLADIISKPHHIFIRVHAFMNMLDSGRGQVIMVYLVLRVVPGDGHK